MSEMSDDFYYYQAKYKGYRSRAAFKLIELDKKFKIFQKGQTVVDLGAAPGGWTQIAAKRVGSKGKVIAIDRAYMPPINQQNVEIITMDIFSDEIFDVLKLAGNIDVILSDVAPNVSGNWSKDAATQIMLAYRVLEIARNVLKKEGTLVCKLFQGAEFENFMRDIRGIFDKVKLYKPPASRKKSAEIYVVAKTMKDNTKKQGNKEEQK